MGEVLLDNDGDVTIVAKEPEPIEPASIYGHRVVYRQGPFAISDSGTRHAGYSRYRLYAQMEVSKSWKHIFWSDDIGEVKAQIKFLRYDDLGAGGGDMDGS